MRVLVYGGTQGVGRSFAQQATAAGHEVTVFARHVDETRTWPTRPTSVVQGDARDWSAVASAVRGHDAVVVSLGPTGRERLQRFIGRATSWIVDAMKAQGVQQLLFMSALGVGDSRRDAPPVFRWLVAPVLLRATYADRADAEAIVKRSDLDWTIARPLVLTDDAGTGRWNATTDMRAVREGIPREDVAAFLLHELTQKQHVREAVALGPK